MTQEILDISWQKLKLLLAARNRNIDSPFYEDNMPLDIFKIFTKPLIKKWKFRTFDLDNVYANPFKGNPYKKDHDKVVVDIIMDIYMEMNVNDTHLRFSFSQEIVRKMHSYDCDKIIVFKNGNFDYTNPHSNAIHQYTNFLKFKSNVTIPFERDLRDKVINSYAKLELIKGDLLILKKKFSTYTDYIKEVRKLFNHYFLL